MPDRRRKANKKSNDSNFSYAIDSGNPFYEGKNTSSISNTKINWNTETDYKLLQEIAEKTPYGAILTDIFASDVLENWFDITDKDCAMDDNLDQIVQSFSEDNNLQQLFHNTIYWERVVGWSGIVDFDVLLNLDNNLLKGIVPKSRFFVIHRNNCKIIYDNETLLPKIYRTNYTSKGTKTVQIDIPAEYVYHFSSKTMNDEYEGESILKRVMFEILYLYSLERTSDKTYTRYGSGFPTFKADKDAKANADFITATNSMIDRMDQVNGVVLPPGYDIDFKGASGKEIDPTKYYDIYISALSGGVSISKNKLIGMDEGLQAADIQQKNYSKTLRGYQKLFDNLIRNFIIGVGVIADGQWKITWNDPAVSRKEQLENDLLQLQVEQLRQQVEIAQ